jgi:predicted house-cleaning NTP pyrophosphatase (Maf/HAM1 superfamily)
MCSLPYFQRYSNFCFAITNSVQISRIHFKEFPDEVIDRVIARGDVFTSAGGLKIADPDLSQYLDRLNGTHESVEGLPLLIVRQLIFHLEHIGEC